MAPILVAIATDKQRRTVGKEVMSALKNCPWRRSRIIPLVKEEGPGSTGVNLEEVKR